MVNAINYLVDEAVTANSYDPIVVTRTKLLAHNIVGMSCSLSTDQLNVDMRFLHDRLCYLPACGSLTSSRKRI